jgi:hypothetical protein
MILNVTFAPIENELLKTGAYILTDSEYSPVIRAIGEAFLTELKDRIGTKSIEWHEFDLRRFTDAELILAETQLHDLRDEAPAALAGYFGTFKFSVHSELIQRSTPEWQ